MIMYFSGYIVYLVIVDEYKNVIYSIYVFTVYEIYNIYVYN